VAPRLVQAIDSKVLQYNLMVNSLLRFVWIFVACAEVAACCAQSPPPLPASQRNASMKTRDGVTLRADIYGPAGEGKYPTLLQRTPYDKDATEGFAPGRRQRIPGCGAG
jgi:predicted acyl esterase